jgi:phosphatidate cytidylyltransferase
LVFDHALYAHAIIGIVILFELLKLPLSPIPLKLLVIAFYAILIGLILILTLSSSLNLFFFILLATAIYDGYSQLFGRIFGKVKLAKNISPNKTIAGAVGGFGACLVFGLTFKNTQPIVFLLPPLALAGDLFASALKRKAGVKDFSNILPYQGGFLDRFDSYLFTCLGAIILDLLK